jgi:hypothetical protein
MTATELDRPTAFTTVTLDLYRDIHKGIRSELFAVTNTAGRVDPADTADVAALSGHVDAVVALLVSHAEHEDTRIQDAIVSHLPDVAARVESEHAELDARMVDLRAWATEAVGADAGRRRAEVHRLYLELASFTSAYLAHQDVEERVVMPALEAALGVDTVVTIHGAIVGSIPPDEMAQSLAIMLPAMNVDDRAELLGGMRAGAPPEVFSGVWSLATSVLAPRDATALANRLGL